MMVREGWDIGEDTLGKSAGQRRAEIMAVIPGRGLPGGVAVPKRRGWIR